MPAGGILNASMVKRKKLYKTTMRKSVKGLNIDADFEKEAKDRLSTLYGKSYIDLW